MRDFQSTSGKSGLLSRAKWGILLGTALLVGLAGALSGCSHEASDPKDSTAAAKESNSEATNADENSVADLVENKTATKEPSDPVQDIKSAGFQVKLAVDTLAEVREAVTTAQVKWTPDEKTNFDELVAGLDEIGKGLLSIQEDLSKLKPTDKQKLFDHATEIEDSMIDVEANGEIATMFEDKNNKPLSDEIMSGLEDAKDALSLAVDLLVRVSGKPVKKTTADSE